MPTLLRLPYWALLFWAVLHAVASAAPGLPLQPGIYIRTGDTGTLTLRRAGAEALRFELDTFGVSGNLCSAAGWVSDRVATADALFESSPHELCKLALETRGARIRVRVLTEACASLCGLRAFFDGDYGRPSASCTGAAISQRRAQFLKQYRVKQHAQAVQSAEALLKDCSDFLFWITQDGIRSDLALAQLRAGRPQACLATLEQTAAGKAKNEDDLRRVLPPVAFDSYEWAKPIWHNRRLCQQAISSGVGRLDQGRNGSGATRP
ncbi:MAG: hypothetical protein U1E77_11545 [Inhella sp.]